MRSSALIATLSICSPLVCQTFVDESQAANLTPLTYSIGTFGRGSALADFDRDGDLDLVMPDDPSLPLRYYENDGLGQFVDRTASAGLPLAGLTVSMSAADVDNDGDLDLYVGRIGADALLINDGSGVFVDATSRIGGGSIRATWGAAFGDYDLDGDLDIALAVWDANHRNALLRNDGGGLGFTDVAVAAGVAEFSTSFVAMWMDYDEDGWPDLYIVNDKGDALRPNSMYRNLGNGQFVDVGPQIGARVAMQGMGGDFVDAFNDGGQDIYATDAPPDHAFLVWNSSTQRYDQLQDALGVQGGPLNMGWGCQFFDYDNNGWQDLYVVDDNFRNLLYRNPGAPAASLTPWPNIASSLFSGTVRNQSTMVMGDVDNDGRVDIIDFYLYGVPPERGLTLWMNRVPAGNWLRIRTVGTVSNRDGFGCRIALTAGGMTQRQSVRSGVGFAGSSDHRVHFGLGTAAVVDRVELIWPSGQRQVLTDVLAGRDLTIEEPQFVHTGPLGPGATSTLSLSSTGDSGHIYAMPLSLTQGSTMLPSGRTLPFGFDAVTAATLLPNPIVVNGVGILPAGGRVSANLVLPNAGSIHGLTFWVGALTFDPGEPDAVRTILPAIELAVP